MELQYEKALKEHKLKVSDLSEDAKVGVEQINGVLNGIKMLEKKGQKVTEKTLKKLRAMDKWVYYEILDQVHGTEKNDEEIPHEKDEVVEEAEQIADNNEAEEVEGEEENATGDTATGEAIDKELEVAYNEGKKQITLAELKTVSKTAYDVIFDNYDENGDNGIETTLFSLIETDDEVFTLTKK